MAQLKFAQVVDDNAEFGLSTRLSVLNGGAGTLAVLNHFFQFQMEKRMLLFLFKTDDDSTIQDLQTAINKSLDLNGFDSKVTISTQADGTMRLVSTNVNLTFLKVQGQVLLIYTCLHHREHLEMEAELLRVVD